MKIKILLILVGVFQFQSAMAQAEKGDAKGNGGRSIVCRDSADNIQSAELLDLYEGRQIRKIEQDIVLSTLSRIDILKKLELKISELDPMRAKRITSFIQNAIHDISSLENNPNAETKMVLFLNDHAAIIDDSFELFVPKNCQVEQFIIQRKPLYPEDRLLNIQKDIWQKMNPVNQIAALYHEAILNIGVFDFELKNSSTTRYIASRLFSDKPLSRLDYTRSSNLGGILISPVQSEMNQPSLYPWESAQLNDLNYMKMFEPYIREGYDPIFTLGKCELRLFYNYTGDGIQLSSYFALESLAQKMDRRGRPMGPLFIYQGWVANDGWKKLASLLSQGLCD